MKDNIAGTYWLVANEDGHRLICQGNKPIKTPWNMGWILRNPPMGWLAIDEDCPYHKATKRYDQLLTRGDFQDLNFPEITFLDGPVEIEIGKSGRVYTYDQDQKD